jgi:hypothetical protein
MRVFAYDRLRPGVTLETIDPLLPEEVATVWRLWKKGIVRENYMREDEPGAVVVFEVGSVEEARQHTAAFPLTRAGYVEWFFVALRAPMMLESQFSAEALERAGR